MFVCINDRRIVMQLSPKASGCGALLRLMSAMTTSIGSVGADPNRLGRWVVSGNNHPSAKQPNLQPLQKRGNDLTYPYLISQQADIAGQMLKCNTGLPARDW